VSKTIVQDRMTAGSGDSAGMLDFIQQLVSGVALGCIYALIALGSVLIYKTTEAVNFAQGYNDPVRVIAFAGVGNWLFFSN